ncbi:Calcium/calmodulin-dependent 3',5'-cyclic nucleotide phosphodiesterase 1C, partial [Stegodyphus mimosarum]
MAQTPEPNPKKCQGATFTLGGYSYKIVANAPDYGETGEKLSATRDANREKTGNGTPPMVIRRSSPRAGQLQRCRAQETDSLDQSENRLPPVDTMEACNKAAKRLRELARHLQHGEIPVSVLQNALQYAACVLDTVSIDDSKLRSKDIGSPTHLEWTTVNRRQFRRLVTKSRRTLDDEDELSEFQPNAVPTEVRDWLASTFTKKPAAQRKRSEDKPR